MYLKAIKIRNYRRLSDVKIDLEKDISIFVGANNSGKTSVAHAIHFFINSAKDRVAFHDISACRWRDVADFERGEGGVSLPEMSVDLWFDITEDDLHRVIDLLPGISWQGTNVGVRISFCPSNETKTLARFKERHEQAQLAASDIQGQESGTSYVAPPRTLQEYLETELRREYEFRYFVLDHMQFDSNLEQKDDYEPQELLPDQGRTGKDIINSLIKVDFLHAQRHLSDTSAGSRVEELSSHLGRYYQRNLERHTDNYNVKSVLAESETLLNKHLEQVFSGTLQRLAQLGYPGLTNPRMMIKSALNPAKVMSSRDSTHVHYALDDEGLTLPDKYNGLGYKNLIYMVVELLDLHAQWLNIEDSRPPLHLVFVEEPEAHLHAQLQQVFVNKVLDILAMEGDEPNSFHTQLALTTHSPHVLYERGFRPVRYFRRENTGVNQSSQVLNLSEFYQTTGNPSRDFLERYLKLTHCDLFFADAAILVEGNVERLIMPQMIAKSAPGLRSCYLSVLEIGGAFGHLFRTLIEFLGITTLVITDLDSVVGSNNENEEGEGEATETWEVGGIVEDDVERDAVGSTCTPETPNAVTSNQMLVQWLPGKTKIADLLNLKAEGKTLEANESGRGLVRVTYPSIVKMTLGDETIDRAGRTLEVAFAFENLDWTQQDENKDLKLSVTAPQNLEELALRLHKKVHSSNYKKTDFALALLAKNPDTWIVPSYVMEGLQWLEATLGVKEQGGDHSEGDSA